MTGSLMPLDWEDIRTQFVYKELSEIAQKIRR
jgi:hypothetical protein